MEKLVRLKLEGDSLEKSLAVTLQMGDTEQPMMAELTGTLPPIPKLEYTYQRWQNAYRRLAKPYRLELRKEGFPTNVSRVEDCHEVASELSQQFNIWLDSASFRPLREKLLERLLPSDTIRVVIQTSLAIVRRLPWHLWDLWERYPNAEIALSAPAYEHIKRAPVQRQQVRILAILGHSQNLDIETDQALLNHLPNADVQFLVEPNRQQLNQALWQPQGWDILFFAGHSASQVQSSTETTGRLYINPTDALTIPEVKYALKKSLERGLKIALFNSCDGLGLAQALADLQIPQVLVMREPVPDQVAHEFLKSFLESFSRGELFYLAVREARHKLHGLEDRYPCASWLPIICQNPAEQPPTWDTLSGQPIVRKQIVQEISSDAAAQPVSSPLRTRANISWKRLLLTTLMSACSVLGVRQVGLLQPWELNSLDWLMRLRPLERPDPRILIIEVTEEDVRSQNPEQRQVGASLSDAALSDLLKIITPMEPRVIGLDIYRDFPVLSDQPQLIKQLRETEQLFVVCKGSDETTDTASIAPPPEVPETRVGFSDAVADPDGILRRHLLSLAPEPASDCQASYGLSTLVALKYLDSAGIDITITATDNNGLQMGNVTLEPLDTNFGGYHGINAGGSQIMLNYRHTHVADHVTLDDVRSGRVSPNAIRDRIILMGTTAPSFKDYWRTPYTKSQYQYADTAGIMIQAHAVSQLISAVLDQRHLIQAWPDWLEILWIISWAVMGGGIVYVSYQFSCRYQYSAAHELLVILLASCMAEFSLFGCCWLALVYLGYWLPWSPAAISLITTVIAVWTISNSTYFQALNLIPNNPHEISK